MSLLLCRKGKDKTSLYIEVLGIHIYSSQELCYVIYHHPLLVMNDFVDASLFFFVKMSWDLAFLQDAWKAGGSRRRRKRLCTCSFLNVITIQKEIQKFKQVTASYRNLSQNAYGKAVQIIFFPETVWKSTAEV